MTICLACSRRYHSVDFDILRTEDPDIALFDNQNLTDSLIAAEGEICKLWSSLDAVSTGHFAVTPALMHNLLGSLVLVQSMSLVWMAAILLSEYSTSDLPAEMDAFYRTFYFLKKKEEFSARVGESAVGVKGDEQ